MNLYQKYLEQFKTKFNREMRKLTEDEIRDIAIRITDKLVELGFVPNCIDSDDESEFEVQDVITEEITKSINL